LNRADRKKLEKLALERLDATANDNEQWSFLFRTDGFVGYLYCPWSETEDWDFDGTIEGLDLPWSAERLNFIKYGKADPTENELRQWRQAKCRSLASGSDSCWIAWIVPLWIDQKIAGYALFVCSSYGDLNEAPFLEGIFASLEEARVFLTKQGALDERD